MRERRRAKRITLNHPILVAIEDRRVPCTLTNISGDGALLELQESGGGTIESSDVGQDVRFRVKTKSGRVREYTGEVIRLYYKDGTGYVALRFWEKYRDVSS